MIKNTDITNQRPKNEGEFSIRKYKSL